MGWHRALLLKVFSGMLEFQLSYTDLDKKLHANWAMYPNYTREHTNARRHEPQFHQHHEPA